MNLAGWAHAHRRSLLFLLAVLAAAGAYSAFSLPVSLFPHVSFPRVVVSLDAGDRPAERMALEVTRPVEVAVRALPGVRSVRSTSSRGSAEVSITFDWGLDMAQAKLQVESAVNQVLGSLPPGTTFLVRRMDPTVFPVLGYSLTSGTRSLVELRDLALYQIRPVLQAVPGVARVGVLGGKSAEYQIFADPAKLDSYGLTLDDVARAVSAANVVTAVGKLEEYHQLFLVVSNTRFQDFNQIGRTVISSGATGLVRLEDVATVSRGRAPNWTRVTADGHDAVLFQIYQQPGGNTVEIGRQIRARLARLRGWLPAGVRIANWYDQSQLITASAGSVRDAVIIGIILAVAVLLIFVRNAKVTLIAALTVPAVLAVTTLLLYALGMSFNIMTLGGMAAAVGLIIDDAIVMIEHVIRRLRGGSGHHRERVLRAATELTPPLVGSSLSTVIIFAPLAFLSGVTGSLFKALSLTMAVSLVVSFLVAWLAVPLLAVHLLGPKDTEQPEGGRWTAAAGRAYAGVMQRVLARPALVLLVVVPLVAAGWAAYRGTGSGFMPTIDEGGFILDYYTAPGTSLTETDRLLRQVEDILRTTPAVQTYSRRTGLQLGGGVTEANQGDYFIRLKPPPRPGIEQVMDGVRERIEHTVPGLHVEMAQLMEDLIGDLTAVPQPIEVKLFSDDGALLRATAPRVAAAVGKVPGVVEVNDGIVVAGDALDVRVDREKAALEGVAPDDVTKTLEGYLSGLVTTQVQRGPKMVNLRVWIPQGQRANTLEMEGLRLRAPDGHLFPLKRVASLQIVTGQPEIDREDLKRMVAVTGRINGRDMGSTVGDVKAVLSRPGLLPPGVYYSLGGLYREQQTAFRGLVLVFLAAAALVFFLLLFLYESFRVALAMLATTLLAATAVFIGLWLTGTELNISAMMGMTMIIGIVTEVEIFYFSEYRALPEQDGHARRYILAGLNRARPIVMTTLAAMLALTPLALAVGQGSAMQQPLAIAIISGLVVQLPLVLMVLPALLAALRPRTP